METLMLVFWIVAVAAIVGFVFSFIKSKKKKPVEKEIFSAPLDTEEPKVEPAMPEMPKEDERMEDEEIENETTEDEGRKEE
jgi:hypothetical protein